MSGSANPNQKAGEIPAAGYTARPGLLLSTMAVLCGVLILVPTIGTVTILYQAGVLDLGVTLAILREPSLISHKFQLARIGDLVSVSLAAMTPMVCLFIFAVTFLFAFFRRASWAPSVLSTLALIWAISISISMILVPVLAMGGGLPMLTLLNMIPGMIAPIVFSLGFAGFLLKTDESRSWFSVQKLGVDHV